MTTTLDLDLDVIRLDAGRHRNPEHGMCVMEAASLLSRDGRFTDRPACVSPAIGAFLRSWNDELDDDTRQQLKRYIPLVVGTATGPEDEERRAWLATDWLVRTFTPAWLDLAGLTGRARELRDLPELTSLELLEASRPIIDRARRDADAARDAAGFAAWDALAAGAAAWGAAAWDAAWAAAAWDAAWDAAAAWAAARDAAAWAAARAAAAWDAAWAAAAWDALADTATELQQSAHDLLDRMIAVGRTRALEG